MSEAASPADMYSLHEARELCLRVYYPNVCEQLVLRTDLDWDKDVLPTTIDSKDSYAEFKLETTHPFFYLKPCLKTASGLLWATGANRLMVATREDVRDIYPSFYSSEQGTILDVITLESKILNRQHSLRVYLPAGYDENTCRPFPVIYMQDGRNLFFPQEAVHGAGLGR